MISARRALSSSSNLLDNVSKEDIVVIQGDAIYDFTQLSLELAGKVYVLEADCTLRGLHFESANNIQEHELIAFINQTSHIIKV